MHIYIYIYIYVYIYIYIYDRHDLLHNSPLLKNTCVGQGVLDKW